MERIPAFRTGYDANNDTGTVCEARPAPCPHCGDENLRLTIIRTRDEARSYSDSPAVLNRIRGHTPGRVSSVQPSPLKVGDSMENMMRKMLTYEQCGININAPQGQRITVLGDITTPGRDSPPLCDRDDNCNNLPGTPLQPFPPLPEDRVVNENYTNSSAQPPAHQENVNAGDVEGGERRQKEEVATGADSLSGSTGFGLRVPGGSGAVSLSGSGRPPLPLPGVVRGMGGTRSRSISPLPPASPGVAREFQGELVPATPPPTHVLGEHIAWEVRA